MKLIKTNRSILEILGILAMVIALISVGIFGYNEAMYRYKMNIIKQQIGTIATNVKNAYFGREKYDNLSNEAAISMGLIPDSMRDKSDKNDPYAISNAFGGKVIIMATTAATGETCEATEEKPCDSFVIQVTNLPKKPTLELSVFPWKYLDMLNASVDAVPTEGKPAEIEETEQKKVEVVSVKGVSVE